MFEVMGSYPKRTLFLLLQTLVFAGISDVSIGQTTPKIEDFYVDSNATRSAFEKAVRHLEQEAIHAEPGIPEVVESVWLWSQIHGDSVDIIHSKIIRARSLHALGLKSQAIKILKQVRKSPHTDDSLMFSATIILRDYYLNLDAIDKAFELHQEINWDYAPDFYQRYAPDGFMGNLYFKIGDYERALESYKTSIRQMREASKPYWELSYTNSRGFTFEKMGLLDSALSHYLRAEYILENQIGKNGSNSIKQYLYLKGLILGNRAQILAKQGLHQEAIPLYRQDIEASLQGSSKAEYRQNATTSLTKLASSYLAISEKDLAWSCLERASELIRKDDNLELWINLYQRRSEYFDHINDPSSALRELQKLVLFKDSAQNHQKVVTTQNMMIAYESIITEREKLLQEQKIRELEMASDTQRDTNLFFIMVIVLSLIITGGTVYRFRRKSLQQVAIEKQNQEIAAQKETIESSLKEKEVLLREVNHRVKNNLQIVSSLLFLQSRDTENAEAREMINEAHQRIQTISVIHQKLYQESQYDSVEFDTYLSDLIRQTISSYRLPELEVETNIDIQYLGVSMDQAIPLSLIIHELVTNSMKHAFTGLTEGMIAVQLRKEGNTLSLRYEDDGSGLVPDPENTNFSHIGMKVIELLIQQIGGVIHLLERKPLIIRIDFKDGD